MKELLIALLGLNLIGWAAWSTWNRRTTSVTYTAYSLDAPDDPTGRVLGVGTIESLKYRLLDRDDWQDAYIYKLTKRLPYGQVVSERRVAHFAHLPAAVEVRPGIDYVIRTLSDFASGTTRLR